MRGGGLRLAQPLLELGLLRAQLQAQGIRGGACIGKLLLVGGELLLQFVLLQLLGPRLVGIAFNRVELRSQPQYPRFRLCQRAAALRQTIAGIRQLIAQRFEFDIGRLQLCAHGGGACLVVLLGRGHLPGVVEFIAQARGLTLQIEPAKPVLRHAQSLLVQVTELLDGRPVLLIRGALIPIGGLGVIQRYATHAVGIDSRDIILRLGTAFLGHR